MLLPLLLLALLAPDTPACDGIPPEIVNESKAAISYTLECGKKTEKRELKPDEKHILDGFSGCTLKLGEHAETLHTEMVCEVDDAGKVVCDLL